MSSHLDEVGAIPADYRHVSKVVHPARRVEAAGGLLKWYDIAERRPAGPARDRRRWRAAAVAGGRDGRARSPASSAS